MFSNRASIPSALASFRLDGYMLCYSAFVPKLYNWCLALGFDAARIMPSRAFCSDESQGFPTILMTKHFGAFPFNHGRVGGIVSLNRHAPHAEHGKDLLLLQASHVGYDADSGEFGVYRRLRTEHETNSCSCGKIGSVIESYAAEYAYASENIRLMRHDGELAVLIDYLLISRTRGPGLFPLFERLVRGAGRELPRPLATRSTGHVFPAAETLIARLGEAAWPTEGSEALGTRLEAEDFYYRREGAQEDPFQDQLEENLLAPMPWIVTAKHPLLTGACANTLAEFERTYRSFVRAPVMHGRNLLFVAGLNIDISPKHGDDFPLTKFVPWAAYLQRADGTRQVFEQDELFTRLNDACAVNPSQLDLERAIQALTRHRDVVVRL